MWIMRLCELVIMCIGETWWIMWIWWFGKSYEFVIGEICHLTILFDDDHFVDSNEVWIICTRLVIFFGDDDFLAYNFEMMNCDYWVD